MLREDQIRQFREVGYVIARGVLDAAGVAALTGEFDTWIEQSRAQTANYGETLDGKARFDLEAGHTAERPRLRRVANPVDVSAAYRQALFDSPIPDRVAELIGPDVKFHHCKLNIKLPGMATRVDYHQDHAYDPHTNSDMLAMLLLDDTNQANDGLRVVPGSHRERYSHYRDGRFIGAIDPALDEDFEARSVPIEGERGDVCLMHTWTVHGGGPNHSDRPRRLLICDYVAVDAYQPVEKGVIDRVSRHGEAYRGEGGFAILGDDEDDLNDQDGSSGRNKHEQGANSARHGLLRGAGADELAHQQ